MTSRRLTPERRWALELLAKSRHGANEELLVHGHGFKRPMLVGQTSYAGRPCSLMNSYSEEFLEP
jgi:hypothetical protein